MRLLKESATFSSCRFNFFKVCLIPNSRFYESKQAIRGSGWLEVLGEFINEEELISGGFDALFQGAICPWVRGRSRDVRLG